MLRWTVSTPTRKRYTRCVISFLRWVIDSNEGNITTMEQLDGLLMDYVHELFEVGKGRTAATHLLYGLYMYMPHWKGTLPRSTQSIHGWVKQTPSQSYPPLTWELAVLIACKMASGGHRQEGIAVLLSFDCLLRVSEMTSLMRSDIAGAKDDRIGGEHKGTVVRIRKAKTGVNQWVTIVNRSVEILIMSLCKDIPLSSEDRLFPFSPTHFRSLLHNICASLGLSDKYVPHSLRHGGATRYRHVLGWSVEDVLERGRWASVKSARIYIQAGVAISMSMTIPPSVAAIGRSLASDIVASFNASLASSQPHYTAPMPLPSLQ